MKISWARLCFLVGTLLNAQTSANWTRQIPETFPPGRFGHAIAYDVAHGEVILFGGRGLNGLDLSDTWAWDGSNWAQKSPQTVPPPRHFHSMAYDSARGEVVLFGGIVQQKNLVYLNDTWVWDGSNWTQRFPSSMPAAQSSAAMVFDSAHGQAVLFGSGQQSASLNETWVWDGSNWTQLSPQSSPGHRLYCAMAYDSKRGQVILFGGNTGGLTYVSDTWAWDGGNWTQQFPETSPPGRTGYAMAYDSAHDQTVMFGGESIIYADGGFVTTYFNDTWVWDGSNWIEQNPQTSPQIRWIPAMVYDSASSVIVLFGGVNDDNIPPDFTDTWTWGGGPLPTVPSIGSVVSASSYGGFSAVSPGSFVEVYGSNLAFDTRGWTSVDFTGNQAPTMLDGVEVSLAGQKTFVNYIVANPGQVNVELPSNIPTGTQQITVTNKNGTSAPFNVTVNATEPGLLAPASFKIGGKQYVVAFHSDNVTYVLPEGAIAGLPSRPAKPGETIVMYGNGFGPVTPNIPAGELAEGNSQLVASLEILFGETSGKLAYDGLSPGLVGVYQFDVVVPAIPDNDLAPLSFKLGGVAGTQVLYTAVHQ